MNTLLFFSLFATLAIFYTILGFFASTKVSTTNDYFLAGRDLGLFSITMTLIATQIGGGMLIGTSENAYLYGIYGLLYTIGMTIGFALLAAGFARRLQVINVSTTAEIFEKKYNSLFLKQIASFLSIITMSGLLVGQIVASRTIIDSLNLGMATEWLFLSFWIFVILYTMAGGLKAVVITDVFQVLLIIFIFAGVFIYSLLYGPPFAWNSIGALQKEFFGTVPISLNALVATVSMPALFSLIEQDLAQRFFAARTPRIAALGALLSCIGIILFALIPIYFGMQAKLLGIVVPVGTSPLIPVIEFLTNEFVVMLCLCAIIAAITSTADSLLCAVSSNVAQDFELKWIGLPDALYRSKVITLVLGIAALIASYFVPQNVITILIDSYAISVSCLLVPLLVAYCSDRVSKSGAIAAVICGGIAFILIPFWNTELPKVLAPVLISAIAYCLVAAFTKSD
jgi:solute:Na+ symporter, SSS family